MRLRNNLTRENGVDESGVDDSLNGDILRLFCGGIVNLSGDVDWGADGAVDGACGAVAAVVASKDIARAAESIRVEGAHWCGRHGNVA